MTAFYYAISTGLGFFALFQCIEDLAVAVCHGAAGAALIAGDGVLI
jgi:hypothetical protein